ncbi:MAG: hypothetical protein RL095_845 [Verrucomicrobiota bacterium]|jgi:hypothetical protein
MIHTSAGDNIDEIENRIEDIFSFALKKRRRNFFVRFDLRFPDDGVVHKESDIFKKFIQVFIQNQGRNYGDVFYVAVREKAGSISGHFHIFILYDGRNVRSSYAPILKAKELWAYYLSKYLGRKVNAAGLVQYGRPIYWFYPGEVWPYSVPRPDQSRGVMITRGSEEFDAHLDFAKRQAFYLAKAYSKASVGKHHHSWRSSQGIPSRFAPPPPAEEWISPTCLVTRGECF